MVILVTRKFQTKEDSQVRCTYVIVIALAPPLYLQSIIFADNYENDEFNYSKTTIRYVLASLVFVRQRHLLILSSCYPVIHTHTPHSVWSLSCQDICTRILMYILPLLIEKYTLIKHQFGMDFLCRLTYQVSTSNDRQKACN